MPEALIEPVATSRRPAEDQLVRIMLSLQCAQFLPSATYLTEILLQL